MPAGPELVLLVGGNPLPNCVVAEALHQQGLIDRVRLLFTREVEATKNRLRQCLAPIPLSPDVQVNPADAQEIWPTLPTRPMAEPAQQYTED
jgi:hypothetical protein